MAKRGAAGPDERAQQILHSLVKEFIRDGQPVGSKRLSEASGLSVSPATIRNIMADLEDYGFIAAPHTSAGRIPTPKGYRFFVDTLVQLQKPAARDINELQSQLGEDSPGDAKALAETASSALSTLTSLAGVVTLPRQSQVTLRQIEFLPIADRRVLAILVVNDSEVQNRVLTLDRDYSAEELQRAANFLNQTYGGRDIRDIRALIVEELQQTQETMNQLMIDTVTIAQRALDASDREEGFVLAGQTKLMGFDELSDIDRLRQLFEAFSQQREILRLLDRSIEADGIQIFIGEESGYQMLDNCSVIAAPYKAGDDVIGVLGVIGPTRMAYDRVIPIVDVTAKLVGAALNSGRQTS